MRARPHLLAVSSACYLAGCTVGPDFHRPDPGAPAAWWRSSPADVGSAPVPGGTVDASWWNEFHDPELSSLVTRLAKQNIDLQSAAERVRQAREQRRIAASQGLPNLDAEGLYQRIRPSTTLAPKLFELAPGAPEQFDVWQDDLSASWEVDLFGRVRRAVEARHADTEAAIEARHGVALMAVADLAQDYMQLRGAQAMEAVTLANLADAEENAALVRNRYGNGVSTTLDIANAEAQRATIEADLPPLRATEARLINAIGYLLAEPPRALDAELRTPGAQPPVPPNVPIGLPGELARRRPDIREAEARLHAATAETGVAVANFYPDLRLTGQIGSQSLQFPQLFNLTSGYYMVGPQLDLPIFEGGRLRAMLRLRKSEQQQAALAYRNTVLQAWQDADNALTLYAEAQHRRGRIAEAVQNDRVALSAARQRYAQGAVDYLNVLTVQDALLQNEERLTQSDMEVETDLVTLYRALGGGWKVAG